MFTAGMAVYLGLQQEANRGLTMRRYVLRGTVAVLSILIVQAVSGMLFCFGLAAYAKLYGMGVLRPGGDTGSFFLGASLDILFISLIASLISCALGCAIGTAAGVTLWTGSENPTNKKYARHWHGTTTLAVIVCGFIAINMAALYGQWVKLVIPAPVWRNGLLQPPMAVSLIITSMLGSNIWVCIAVLWFLWLRRSSKILVWKRWLLLALLTGLAAFFFLPMLC
jgi:hypothetical protein